MDDSTSAELKNEITLAVRAGDVDVVVSLLARNNEAVNWTTFRGTWLHEAAKLGHSNLVERLIELGIDVNSESELSGIPLNAAAGSAHADVVEKLIRHGADLQPCDPKWNALFSAIYNKHTAIAKILIDNGFDAKIVYRSVTGQLKNAMSFATEQGATEIVELLAQLGCKMPNEEYDSAVNEPPKTESTSGMDYTEILKHLTASIGPVEPVALQGIVPVHDDVHISVNVIRPNENCPFMTVFTTGMSEMAMTVPEGQEEFQYAELLMYLPGDWEIPQLDSNDEASLWPFQWLRNAAYLPHQNDTWLGGPHTIISSDAPPVPLGPNTDMTCLLLNADMAEWSPLELSDGRKIRFYTAMPIYTEERDLEVEYGVIALMQKFEEIGIPPIVFPGRPNVGEIKG